jgi:hypothetical protein
MRDSVDISLDAEGWAGNEPELPGRELAEVRKHCRGCGHNELALVYVIPGQAAMDYDVWSCSMCSQQSVADYEQTSSHRYPG